MEKKSKYYQTNNFIYDSYCPETIMNRYCSDMANNWNVFIKCVNYKENSASQDIWFSSQLYEELAPMMNIVFADYPPWALQQSHCTSNISNKQDMCKVVISSLVGG